MQVSSSASRLFHRCILAYTIALVLHIGFAPIASNNDVRGLSPLRLLFRQWSLFGTFGEIWTRNPVRAIGSKPIMYTVPSRRLIWYPVKKSNLHTGGFEPPRFANLRNRAYLEHRPRVALGFTVLQAVAFTAQPTMHMVLGERLELPQTEVRWVTATSNCRYANPGYGVNSLNRTMTFCSSDRRTDHYTKKTYGRRTQGRTEVKESQTLRGAAPLYSDMARDERVARSFPALETGRLYSQSHIRK